MNKPDLRGAIALPPPGQRRVFVPATAEDLRKRMAMELMNGENVNAWAHAMGGIAEGFLGGHAVVEVGVPEGGADVLALLGYHTQFVGKEGNGDLVRVCLTDPFVTSKVLS